MIVWNAVGHTQEIVVAEHAELLAERSRALWVRGLTIGTCGSASLRVPGTDAVLIKGTGVCMGEMTAADAVLVTLNGQVLAGDHDPSCETACHLAIYRRRSDVGAVVHARPPYATAWAVNNRVPPLLHVAAREFLGPIALVELAPPGSAHLAALIEAAFRQSTVRAALLCEHGIFTVAANLGAAVQIADHVEDAAKVATFAGAIADLNLDQSDEYNFAYRKSDRGRHSGETHAQNDRRLGEDNRRAL